MIALAIALAAAPAAAPPADGYIQVYNYPSEDSCASWTADRARKDQTLEAWQTLMHVGPGMVGAGTTGAGLVAWVDKYCAANPLVSVTTASFKLIRELENTQTR